MRLGRVEQLWRYPVKSMRGDRVQSTPVTGRWGVPGDRGWVVRDEDAAEIRSAKKLPILLQFHARYLAEPRGASTPALELTFPGGTTMRSDHPDIHSALSDAVGRKVTLWSRRPADDDEHYRRGRITEADVRAQLDLGPEDPLPDFATLPEELLVELADYATPRGTYFDALPLSLLTTTSLTSLQDTVPDAAIDPRRFRKNLIVDTGDAGSGFPEFDWVGRRLHIGEVVCEVVMPISRCVMVGLPQDDLPHDRGILRSLARNSGTDLGVYLRVVTPGTVHEGDMVSLEPEE